METDNLKITPQLESRCDIRLQNDMKALEAVALSRMHVDIERFGKRISMIRLTFPEVVTAFFNNVTKQVEIRPAIVSAYINPHAGSSQPYPKSEPEVRIYFPELTRESHDIPWLGGLHWFQSLETINDPVSVALHMLMAALHVGCKLPVGLPCLWRTGEWNPNRDLIFVARQIHHLLTDPGDYSPTDCLNPEAAIYWADHKDMLPLELPIPELYFEINENFRQKGSSFSLREVNKE